MRQDGELRGPHGSTLLAEAGCSTRSPTIGTNKRYSDHYDRLAADRILQQVARDSAPESLSERELDLANQDRTIPPRARPCRVWVRYAGNAVLVDAEVCAWTSRAAAVRWRVDADRIDRAWVWASAVEPRGDPER